MSLRGGCAVACAIWLGVNTYIGTISFMGYNPIFSFLNWPALIVLGSFSIVFGLVALLILYGLFVDTPGALQPGVAFLFFIVPIYLIDILANIFVFGIQKPMYMNWCLSNSKGNLNENIVVMTGEPPARSMINPTEITSLDTYNCQKLWEDELKFSLAILIIMTICYTYWCVCVFHYYEKLRDLFPKLMPNGGFMGYLGAPQRFLPQAYRNEPPSKY